MIVPQSPIVSPGVLERELVYLSPRLAGAIDSGGRIACELRTNSLSPRGTNGERAGERGGLRIAPPPPGPLLHSAWRRGRRLPGRHFRPHRTVAGDWLPGDGPSTDNCPFRICPR